MPSVKDIYSKIKVAEEHLRNLRIKLEGVEAAGGKSNMAAVVGPFVDSACASAKAAALAGGLM
jgi:hypothetical protein